MWLRVSGNLLGLDVVSVGAVIAFAMECFEKGILTEEDTGGRALRFGDAEAMFWREDVIVYFSLKDA